MKIKLMIEWSVFFRRLPYFSNNCLSVFTTHIHHTNHYNKDILHTFFYPLHLRFEYSNKSNTYPQRYDLKYLTLTRFRMIVNKSGSVVDPSQGSILPQQWRTDIEPWSKMLLLDSSQGKDASKVSLLKTNFRSNKNSYWTI